VSAAAATPDALSGPRRVAEPRFDARRVVAFMAMVFGMFMAILDIQIVSASLSEIQAGLSASADEVAWVQTSYLIAEVVMIPLSGFLSRVLSTRVMFAVSAAGFTLMSFMCAASTSIDQMIVFWRACQGFIGGGMIPTVFASAYTVFPRDKRSRSSRRSSASWRRSRRPSVRPSAAISPISIPGTGCFSSTSSPASSSTAVTWTLVDFDEPDWSLLDRFDWWGLAGMAAFLGALEYFLEEGR
jgi:DHA2 family multidrug resistance protein